MKIVTNMIRLVVALLVIACFAVSPMANADEQHPNHPQRQINLTASGLQCAPEMVKVSGLLQLHFKKEGSVVVPDSANFTQFRATGERTHRKYEPSKVDVEKEKQARLENGIGSGKFILEFRVIGRPNPPGQPDPNPNKTFFFTVNYKVIYTFDNKVRALNLGDPMICCNPNGCL
jgi:hypothetical protein